MEATTAQTNRQVARAAITVMLAYVVSQLVGLATKILMARAFTADTLDAFVSSNTPCETLVVIMAGGILASSFIPVFINFLVKGERESAWKLASGTANTVALVLAILAGLAALFARPLVVYIFGAGYSAEKQLLTIQLLRIQMISVVFFGLSGLLVGVLNSNQKFLLSALAPAMYSLGQIVGIVFLAPSMGIFGLAWGVVLGSALHMLIQVPALLKLKGQYFRTFGFRDAAVGEVLRLMAPRMFGASAVQLMLWINKLLASLMAAGSNYALTAGFQLMGIAQVAIAQSVGTAVMPTFSAQFAQGRLDDIRRTLASALRGVIFLAVPAAAGLILLGVPISSFLYPTQDAQMISWALTWYSVGLVFHAVLEVLVRAYYAMHDTKTPVFVGASAMLLSIGLSFAFSAFFRAIGWLPHGGLALAVSVSTCLEVSALFFILRRRLKGIEGIRVAASFGTALLGALAMSVVLALWLYSAKNHSAAVITLGGVLLGGLTYLLILIAFRVPEISRLFQSLRRRLLRKIPLES